MRARAVIGSNWGDEGKGLMVDYLCATEGAGIVVRYNGGPQSGHTVVSPSGINHVFHHFGAGSMVGTPTYLSQFFLVNPIAFFRELKEIESKGGGLPEVYAHPNCLVTTFVDMIVNQTLEDKKGLNRHGSCGMGIRETVVRSSDPLLTITMSDLWNGSQRLPGLIGELMERYAPFRCGKKVDEPKMAEAFLKSCEAFAEYVKPLGIEQCPDPIFEGAQGLLLDQDNKEYFPHVTSSHTGMKNVRILCAQAGITDITAYYVSRSYLTRHGAGPLPGEDSSLTYEETTNNENTYQGRLRFAPLKGKGLLDMLDRCVKDVKDHEDFRLVVTHCDQHPSPVPDADLYSFGPTRGDVTADGKSTRRNVAS